MPPSTEFLNGGKRKPRSVKTKLVVAIVTGAAAGVCYALPVPWRQICTSFVQLLSGG